jgi:hypothetical protein
MASAYKVLGQVKPAATTATTLYTAPSGCVVSTIAICSLGVSATYRIAVRPGGATLEDKHYIAYEAALNQYDSVALTIGVTLAAGDVVTVYSSNGAVSFSLFGAEVS